MLTRLSIRFNHSVMVGGGAARGTQRERSKGQIGQTSDESESNLTPILDRNMDSDIIGRRCITEFRSIPAHSVSAFRVYTFHLATTSLSSRRTRNAIHPPFGIMSLLWIRKTGCLSTFMTDIYESLVEKYRDLKAIVRAVSNKCSCLVVKVSQISASTHRHI